MFWTISFGVGDGDEQRPHMMIQGPLTEGAIKVIPADTYPYNEGDTTVIGPECFVTKDGSVLCWKGINYIPQDTEIILSPTVLEALDRKVERSDLDRSQYLEWVLTGKDPHAKTKK